MISGDYEELKEATFYCHSVGTIPRSSQTRQSGWSDPICQSQWTADLIQVINIAKYNRGYRYLLMVADVFSKHAWVQPVKNKTGQAVTVAFEKILKKGRKPINLQTDDGKEFYNKTKKVN